MNPAGLIGSLIIGLIVGALGRWLAPGKRDFSIVATIIIGVISAMLTTWLLGFAFGYNNANGGIPWIGLAISAVVAALIIVGYGRLTGSKS
ncbi:MAG: hypothetical protein Q3997_02205 [Propionibacteriaceae bacterium]|nr:hypothetical protein [Propionibacteriaceae bacterium]